MHAPTSLPRRRRSRGPTMRRWLGAMLVLGGSLATTDPALALRCGTRLVNKGELALQVRDKCGEPISEELIGYTLRPGPGAVHHDGQYYAREYKIVQWVYGPDSGVYHVLTFIGGRLERIEQIKN